MTNLSAMEQFTKTIREILESRGLSISAAARLMGMDHGNLSKILNNKEGLTLDRAERIANHLGVTLCIEVKNSEKISAA